MKRVMVIFIFNLTSIFLVFGQENVSSIHDSGNWKSTNPALISCDENKSSFSRLEDGQTDGWIQYSFESKRILTGVNLKANVPQGAWLAFGYMDAGVRQVIPGSFLTNYNSESFIQLRDKQIVSDSLFLIVYGEKASGVELANINIITENPLQVSQKAELKLQDESENSPYFHNAEMLVDGLTGTVWRPLGSVFGYGYYRHKKYNYRDFEEDDHYFRDKKNTTYHRRRESAYAVFQVREPDEFGAVSIFFHDGATGSLTVKAGQADSQTEIIKTDITGFNGWKSFPISQSAGKIATVRIELEGYGYCFGAMGEIELRKNKEYSGYAWKEIAAFRDQGIPVHEIFRIESLDDRDDYEIKIDLDDTDFSGTENVLINGKTIRNIAYTVKGSVYEITGRLDSHILWSGNNYLTLETTDAARVLGVSVRKITRGTVTQYEGSFSGPEKKINLNEQTLIRQIDLVHNRNTDVCLQIEQAGTLVPLNPTLAAGTSWRFEFEKPIQSRQLCITGEDGYYGVSIWGEAVDQSPYIKVLKSAEIFPDFFSRKHFVSGISNETQAKIYINGKRAFSLGNYFFYPVEKLGIDAPGIYGIEAVIHAGDISTSHKVEYAYGLDSHQIEIDQSEDPVYTKESIYPVSGRIKNSDCELEIAGEKVFVSRRGNFETSVSLVRGLNVIKIEVKEPAKRHRPSRTLAIKYLFVYKLEGILGLKIDIPAHRSYIAADQLLVAGTLENSARITDVSVNGKQAVVTGNKFHTTITISGKENIIQVEAHDQYLGKVTKEIVVYRDLTPPQLQAVLPQDGTWSAAKYVKFTGKVFDDTATQVYINGNLANIMETCFEQIVFLQEGKNTIRIIARDSAGNETGLTPFYINVDTLGPAELQIQSDIAGWSKNNRPVISFTADDAGIGLSHYEVALDDLPYRKQASPFQTPLLSDGVRSIKVKAVDKLGNFSLGEVQVQIDTLPPDIPSTFRAIPGNMNAILEWSEDDEETVGYKIRKSNGDSSVVYAVERSAGRFDETVNIHFFSVDCAQVAILSEDFCNGVQYSFEITAIDQAGNESEPGTASVTLGIAIEEYDSSNGTLIEYENVKLVVGKESLPEDIQEVMIGETVSEEMEELAPYPIISPIYNFSVVDDEGKMREHVQFEQKFFCKLSYDEEFLPEGFPEQNLGVYYFDPMWSKWFKVANTGVDTENNEIYFATNHFTEFSIQPTAFEDLSPQELASIEFDPFSSATKHADVRVSMQGGGVSTSMTEFVLPGKNGLDLEIRRTYDTGTAKGDARGMSLNLSVSLESILTGQVAVSLANAAAGSVMSQLVDSVKAIFQNSGDYAYAFGQGWRLNLPYMRTANSAILIRTSSGSFYNVNAMDIDNDKSFESLSARKLYFKNSEGENFELCVTQVNNPINVSTTFFKGGSDSNNGQGNNSSAPQFTPTLSVSLKQSWYMVEATLREKNGRVYHFDPLGRVTSIADPYGNKIEFHYNALLLDYIKDTYGRKVKFEYSDIGEHFCVPQIRKIWVENDPQGRTASYEYGESGGFGLTIPLPLLKKASDINCREYEYKHEEQFLFSGEFGVKINVIGVIAQICSGGQASRLLQLFGLSSVTIHSFGQSIWTFPLNYAGGYGIGENTISYAKETLEYNEFDAADFFLGIIPTALDISIGLQQRFLAEQLQVHNPTTSTTSIEDYSFDFRYAGEKQFYCQKAVKSNGKLKEVEYFNKYKKKRKRWISWSDLNGISISVGSNGPSFNLFTENPYIIEYLPLSTCTEIYEQKSGMLIERVERSWNSDNLQPSAVKTIRSDKLYSLVQYEYDNWANVTREVYTEEAQGIQKSRTTWNYYAGTNSQKSADAQWLASPLGTTNLDKDLTIKHLLLGSLVANTIPDIFDSPGSTQYINTYYQYNEMGKPIFTAEYVDGQWCISAFNYTDEGEISYKKTPEGHETLISYDYDAYPGIYVVEQTEKTVHQGDGSLFDIISTTGFDYYTGLPLWQKDGRGYVTRFEYDILGRKTLVEVPDDNDNVLWNPIHDSTPAFRTDNPRTVITYNDKDSQVTVAKPEGAVSVFTFHALGGLVEKNQMNRYGSSSETGVGEEFNVTESVKTTLKYDQYNNIISVTDPNGNTTEYEYDGLGNVTRIIFPAVDGKNAEKQFLYIYPTRSKTIINERGYKSIAYEDMQGNVVKTYDLGFSDEIIRATYAFYDSRGKQVGARDGNGNLILLTNNERGQVIRQTMPQAEFYTGAESYTTNAVIGNEYDRAGNKIAQISYRKDKAMRSEFSYNGLGQLITETQYYTDANSQGQTALTKHVYDASGNEVQVIDPLNHSVTRTFSARNQLLSETDALGNATSFTYDALDRKIGMTDPRGNSGNYQAGDYTITYVYDDLDRLIKGYLPRNRFTSTKPEVKLVYDKRGNNLRKINPDGGIVESEYDARNRKVREIQWDATRSRSYVTTTEYDEAGNVVGIIPPGGARIQYRYDTLNRKQQEIQSDGGMRFYNYDANDNLLFEQGSNGYRVYNTYNALNQLIQFVDQEGGVSIYGYDEQGNRVYYKDALDIVRLTGFDELNRPIKETDGRGKVTGFAYDKAGNLIRKNDPRGTVITYTYGPTYLLAAASYVNGTKTHTISYAYDEVGQVKTETDGEVITQYNVSNNSYFSDPYGLIYSETTHNGLNTKTVGYIYDAMNYLKTVQYPDGAKVEFMYNTLGEIISVPGFIDSVINYNSNGYLAGYTMVNGMSLSRAYDQKLRLTDLQYNTSTAHLLAYHFEYDREDNIIQKNNDFFSYDGKSQMISASVSGEEASEELAYDGESVLGQVAPDVLGEKEIVLGGADLELDWGAKSLGIDLGYGYRVKRVVLRPENNSRTRMDESTMAVFTSLYNVEDAFGEPLDVTIDRNRRTGEITVEFEHVQFARYIKIHSHFYEMDEQGTILKDQASFRLDQEAPYEIFILSAGRNEFYSYDPKGNRTQGSIFTREFATNVYQYYPGSDLIKTNGTYAYAYDDNGNMIEKGSVFEINGEEVNIFQKGIYYRYAYDLLNRLEKVYWYNEDTASVELVKTYTYNAKGRRIVAADGSGNTVEYVFDTSGKVLQENDWQYIYLGSKHIARKHRDGTVQYYGTDHLGTTNILTDRNGKAIWSGYVTPFADKELTNGLDEHVKYTGKDLDTETGLYYFNARWYDASIGRFTTVDPVMSGVNWYVYCLNNPLIFIDIDGFEEQYFYIPHIPRLQYTNNVLIHPMTFVDNAVIGVVNDAINLVNPFIVSSQKIYKEGIGAWWQGEVKGVQNTVQGIGNSVVASWKYTTSTPILKQVQDTWENSWSKAEYWEGVGTFAIEAFLTYKALGALYKTPAKAAATPADDALNFSDDAVGQYKDVKGHHIHAKAAFKDSMVYDPNKGWSVSQEFMEQQGWSHSKMTAMQRKLFDELAKSGAENTMLEQSRIAVEALKAGGATEAQATKLVQQSLQNLTEQGVKAPTNIPWNN